MGYAGGTKEEREDVIEELVKCVHKTYCAEGCGVPDLTAEDIFKFLFESVEAAGAHAVAKYMRTWSPKVLAKAERQAWAAAEGAASPQAAALRLTAGALTLLAYGPELGARALAKHLNRHSLDPWAPKAPAPGTQAAGGGGGLGKGFGTLGARELRSTRRFPAVLCPSGGGGAAPDGPQAKRFKADTASLDVAAGGAPRSPEGDKAAKKARAAVGILLGMAEGMVTHAIHGPAAPCGPAQATAAASAAFANACSAAGTAIKLRQGPAGAAPLGPSACKPIAAALAAAEAEAAAAAAAVLASFIPSAAEPKTAAAADAQAVVTTAQRPSLGQAGDKGTGDNGPAGGSGGDKSGAHACGCCGARTPAKPATSAEERRLACARVLGVKVPPPPSLPTTPDNEAQMRSALQAILFSGRRRML